ncbi:MAG TPA: PRC-barrel domain-containing protein [Burkholderiaceae bacterium]|nr:PRC-barrel domain-containing protein [Burkholderiaceae bacterium]
MKRFERLSRLNGYGIDSHHKDPRGWDIVNADHRSIGEVKDLIVDTATMKGVYLDVELDSKLFDVGRDSHILIPVERAEREGKHKHLIVAGLDSVQMQELFVERERHHYAFWDAWWKRGSNPAAGSWSPTISQQLSADDLKRALENVGPGEHVRIPIVNEEIIIERRPLGRDDQADARPAEERPIVTQNVE